MFLYLYLNSKLSKNVIFILTLSFLEIMTKSVVNREFCSFHLKSFSEENLSINWIEVDFKSLYPWHLSFSNEVLLAFSLTLLNQDI